MIRYLYIMIMYLYIMIRYSYIMKRYSYRRNSWLRAGLIPGQNACTLRACLSPKQFRNNDRKRLFSKIQEIQHKEQFTNNYIYAILYEATNGLLQVRVKNICYVTFMCSYPIIIVVRDFSNYLCWDVSSASTFI